MLPVISHGLAVPRMHGDWDGLEHVSMPRTELFQCDQEFDRVISQFEQAGFSYPLVVRRPGSHGANKMTKVDSSAALHDWLMEQQLLPGFSCHFLFDYRWIDGLFHAFRVFFIDGEIYPVSHIISDHWEIHCDNPGLRDRHRLMSSDPSLQEQEKRFLNDPESCILEKMLCMRFAKSRNQLVSITLALILLSTHLVI